MEYAIFIVHIHGVHCTRSNAMAIVKKGPNLFRIDAHVLRSGHETRRRELFTGTRAQAEERYLQLKKELREGGNAAGSLTAAETFGEVLKFYLERHDVGRSTPCFRKLSADLGETPVSCLQERFDRYLQILKRSKGRRTGRPLRNATINRYIAWAKAALNFAVKHGMIKENPVSRFDKMKEVPRDVVLSALDRQRLLNVIEREAPHLSPVVRYAMQVPCRRSELIQMTVDDLDLFNHCIRVRNGGTKNGAGIWKPIPPDMQDYFQSIPAGCRYLFYRQDESGFYGLGDFKRAWKRCLRIAGITDFRFHDTRHCAATALVDNGTPEQVVMSIAGWKSNLLRVYYNREPKKTLDLVHFAPQLGHFMDTPKTEAR
jgi:integrase